jgi:hypothetical protein
MKALNAIVLLNLYLCNAFMPRYTGNNLPKTLKTNTKIWTKNTFLYAKKKGGSKLISEELLMDLSDDDEVMKTDSKVEVKQKPNKKDKKGKSLISSELLSTLDDEDDGNPLNDDKDEIISKKNKKESKMMTLDLEHNENEG